MKKYFALALCFLPSLSFWFFEDTPSSSYTPTQKDTLSVSSYYRKIEKLKVNQIKQIKENLKGIVLDTQKFSKLSTQKKYILRELLYRVSLSDSIYENNSGTIKDNPVVFRINWHDYVINNIFIADELYDADGYQEKLDYTGNTVLTIAYKANGGSLKFHVINAQWSELTSDLIDPNSNYFYRTPDIAGSKLHVFNIRIQKLSGIQLHVEEWSSDNIWSIFQKGDVEEKIINLDDFFIPNLKRFSTRYSNYSNSLAKKVCDYKYNEEIYKDHPNLPSIDGCTKIAIAADHNLITEGMPEWLFEKIKEKTWYVRKISDSYLGDAYCNNSSVVPSCFWITDWEIQNITNYY